MKDFSDALTINELNESYVSQAATNESDRRNAEITYKAELINGPKKTIKTASGSVFSVAVGTFDLESMHKAYDSYYENHGLLRLFSDDGKLMHRGTYGDMKSLDKNEPAVKALLKLWGAQFKDDMKFSNAKATAPTTPEAPEQKPDVWTERREKEAALQDIIAGEIKKTPEWEALKEAYSPDSWANVSFKVVCVFDEGLNNKLDVKQIRCYLRNVKTGKQGATQLVQSFAHGWTKDAPADVAAKEFMASNGRYVAALLTQAKNIVGAVGFMIGNYAKYSQRPEAKIFYGAKFLGYVNPKTGRLYTARIGSVDYGEEGLIMSPAEDPKKTDVAFDDNFTLVMARVVHAQTSYGAYKEKYYDDYYDSKTSEKNLEALGVITQDAPGGNFDKEVHVEDATGEYALLLDKVSHVKYIADSGD